MRGAPPVHVSCTPDRPWCWTWSALHGLAWGVGLHWLLARADWPTGGLPVVLGVAAALFELWRGRSSAAAPARELAWTGERWQLDGQPGKVLLRMDLGHWLLLCFKPEGEPRRAVWLPLALPASGRRAALLRAALVAHAGGPSAPDAAQTLSLHG